VGNTRHGYANVARNIFRTHIFKYHEFSSHNDTIHSTKIYACKAYFHINFVFLRFLWPRDRRRRGRGLGPTRTAAGGFGELPAASGSVVWLHAAACSGRVRVWVLRGRRQAIPAPAQPRASDALSLRENRPLLFVCGTGRWPVAGVERSKAE
jgi:hypothetical protein